MRYDITKDCYGSTRMGHATMGKVTTGLQINDLRQRYGDRKIPEECLGRLEKSIKVLFATRTPQSVIAIGSARVNRLSSSML